jgi:hypothetical protein
MVFALTEMLEESAEGIWKPEIADSSLHEVTGATSSNV